MSESTEIKEYPTKGQKVAIGVVVIGFGLLLLLCICLMIYLATPLPASQLSGFVTSYLHQNFKVEELETSGATLVLKGVRLENPSGFPKGNLAAADSITVAPVWSALIRGGQRYRLVALQGIRINLEKNSQGTWNYSQLQRLLARKPSGAETYIRELVVQDGAFKVQGEGVQGVALKVHNLTTKGSLDSKLDLAFEDSGHNRYVVSGKGRGGSDAALELSLSAPSLSLKQAATALKLKDAAPFAAATGSLQVNASLHKNTLSSTGDFSFANVNVPAAEKNYPVEGTLHFVANYDMQSDVARLETCSISLNDLMTVNATGNARGLKGDRDYALYLDIDDVDLGTLNVLLSDERRKHLFLGGTLRCDSLHILGNRRGLKSAVGTLALRGGSVTKEGRVVIAGLDGSIGLFRSDANILAKGKVAVSGSHQAALVDALNLPFTVTLSPKLSPVSADVPSLAARVMGIPLTGKLSYDVARSNPLSASLNAPATKLSSSVVNEQLKRFDVQAASGTASVALDVSGKGAKDFNGTANIQLAQFAGSRGKTPLAVKKGTVSARFDRKEAALVVQGDADLAGVALDGKGGDLRSSFKVSDNKLYLDGVHGSIAGYQIAVAHLNMPVPQKAVAGNQSRYPVDLDFDGALVRRDKLEVAGLSCRMRGSFNSEGAARWLDGSAGAASGGVQWQGKKLGTAAIHATFARSGAKGDLAGQLFGGKLAGSVLYDPFAKDAAGNYQLGVTGAELATAAALLPKSGLRPTAGALDLHLKGSFGGRRPVTCSFESKGSGIALTNSSGKKVVSAGRLSVTGALSGDNLALKEAVLSPGEGIAVKVKGEVARAFSPKPQGSLAFSLAQTDLNTFIDAFVNFLPRFIQEATVQGTVSADGRLNLRNGAKLMEGALAMKGGRLEVASQKFLVADLNGKLPFSMDLAGKAGSIPQEPLNFSRENYPVILERLRKSGGGQVITIGKIGFGSVETGKVTMNVSADNGLTQISSLKTTLFNGSLTGRGFVRMGEKLSYRGDMLVNDVSLKTLCSAFPGIQGYISGRVDGVISLSGQGGGTSAMTGFTDLWARQGSGEKMVVSKEFLQRLSKQKLSGFFFRTDRPYDKAEIKALLQEGDLTFDNLVIQHRNFFGVKDLSVNIAPTQNRISLEHLLESIKEAAVRGKAKTGGAAPAEAPPPTEFKWGE